MDAISQAAAEITAELPAGSVEVRLRGREPQLVVDVPTAAIPVEPAAPAAAAAADEEEAEDDGALARITLRLPESVKNKAEEMAAKGGHSLNGWIVNVLRAATRERAINVDIDLSSLPFGDRQSFAPGPRRGSKRMTGWV
jgi:hypothetical protein